MNFTETVRKRRSIRRFVPGGMPEKSFRELLELLRFVPSGSNRQKLRYIAVTSPELCKAVFAETMWGRLVSPRRTPEWGKDAPQYFVAILSPSPAGTLSHTEAGAAVQTLLLAAEACGFGGCWLGAFDREKVGALLEVKEDAELLYLIAFGLPAETPVAEDAPSEDSVDYYLDDGDVLHVPKLAAEKLVRFV